MFIEMSWRLTELVWVSPTWIARFNLSKLENVWIPVQWTVLSENLKGYLEIFPSRYFEVISVNWYYCEMNWKALLSNWRHVFWAQETDWNWLRCFFFGVDAYGHGTPAACLDIGFHEFSLQASTTTSPFHCYISWILRFVASTSSPKSSWKFKREKESSTQNDPLNSLQTDQHDLYTIKAFTKCMTMSKWKHWGCYKMIALLWRNAFPLQIEWTLTNGTLKGTTLAKKYCS